MNKKTKKRLYPGQLFEVKSTRGSRCIIMLTKSKQPKNLGPDVRARLWTVIKIHEQEILMLIRTELSPEKGVIPFGGSLGAKNNRCIYEFLYGEILVYIHKEFLDELKHVN